MEEALFSRLDEFDWECEREDTRYLTHDFHPYSSKYIPQIPRNLILALSKKGDTVLDCFVGSGTTLVECRLLGRNAIGVDINPLGCLISKVKSTPIDPQTLMDRTNKLLERIKEKINIVRGFPTISSYVRHSTDDLHNSMDLPYMPHIKYWFQPHVIKELAIIKQHIDAIDDVDIRDFFLVAFSSIIRGVSNAASGFGNIMRSKNPPLKTNTFEKFANRVRRMCLKMKEFNSVADNSVSIKVVLADARKLGSLLTEQVDMICTHPPYMASVPYAEYQKLSLWWLGYDPRKLDSELIGGQRTREDTAERYIRDMSHCFSEMYKVLKEGGYCCTVIGNPVWKGKVWPLNQIFREMGEAHGFKFLKEIVRGKYKMTMGKMKKEYILIFKK
jgi:site-specific DNA-methyltransferase (cytosine-N4-specific)